MKNVTPLSSAKRWKGASRCRTFRRFTFSKAVSGSRPTTSTSGCPATMSGTPIDMLSGSKGWPAAMHIVWQLEEADENGHCVLQMTRGRHYPKPWKRYEFWLEPWKEDPSITV